MIRFFYLFVFFLRIIYDSRISGGAIAADTGNVDNERRRR